MCLFDDNRRAEMLLEIFCLYVVLLPYECSKFSGEGVCAIHRGKDRVTQRLKYYDN